MRILYSESYTEILRCRGIPGGGSVGTCALASLVMSEGNGVGEIIDGLLFFIGKTCLSGDSVRLSLRSSV